MVDDDYTLLSSKDVAELKQDVDYLKKNPLGGTKAGKSLQESIEKLNENIEMLIEIFKEASDMMKAEEREADIIIKRIQPIEQKMEELSDQNQKIAKGILAVADMVAENQRPRPQPQQRPMQPMPRPMPSPSPAPQMAPRLPPMGGMPPAPSSGMPLPPMPPRKEEKKGLFGR
ncbi:hypothetical protein JXB27_00920 [Candidatus Woesearchaeota archaeon]|nr:hypothetical protein [Candidatus Woesearchaeota archaeon]